MIRALSRRRELTAVIAAALAVALVGLGWFASRAMLEGWAELSAAERTAAVVDFSLVAGELVHELQAERGLSVGHVAADGRRFTEELAAQRRHVDPARSALEAALLEHGDEVPPASRDAFVELIASLSGLEATRRAVTAGDMSAQEVAGWYTDRIAEAIGGLEDGLVAIEQEALRREVLAYVALIEAKEASGQLRAALTGVFAAGAQARGQHGEVARLMGRQEAQLERFLAHAPEEVVAAYRLHADSDAFVEVDAFQEAVVARPDGEALDADPAEWFDLATERMTRLREVVRRHAELITTEAREREDAVARQVMLDGLVSALALALLVALVIDRHRAGMRLHRLAYEDPLTGLANRRRALACLEERLRRSAGRPPRVVVLFFDLDRFKLVNDGWGHDIGDALLVAVARRLREGVARGDTVARLGGDEFVVVSETRAAAASAALEEGLALGRRVKDAVDGHHALETGAGQVLVTASVGVAVASAPTEPAELLREANAAMHKAKQDSPDGVAAFDAGLRAWSRQRLELGTALRQALERDELFLVYQPIIDLGGGEVIALEALLRWAHPEAGTLRPAAFLSVAEEVGLMGEIDAWVLDRACREAARIGESLGGERPPSVTVNVSPSPHMLEHGLRPLVEAALHDSGLPAERLVIEITERAMIDEASEAAALAPLRDLGVRIAIDDFGTGYSALTHLLRLPVDVLKIDQFFVAPLPNPGNHRAVVETVISFARTLGLLCVAEGVETEAQAIDLRALGCDAGQGHHWGVPLPAAETARALGRRSSGLSAVGHGVEGAIGG